MKYRKIIGNSDQNSKNTSADSIGSLVRPFNNLLQSYQSKTEHKHSYASAPLAFKTLNQISSSDKVQGLPIVAVVFKGVGCFIAHILLISDQSEALMFVNSMIRCYQHASSTAPTNTNIDRNQPSPQSSVFCKNSNNLDLPNPPSNNDLMVNAQYSAESKYDDTSRVNAAYPPPFDESNILRRHTERQPSAAWINDNSNFNSQSALNNANWLKQPLYNTNSISSNLNNNNHGAMSSVHYPPSVHDQLKSAIGSNLMSNYRIRYADGREITEQDINTDPALLSTLNILKSMNQNGTVENESNVVNASMSSTGSGGFHSGDSYSVRADRSNVPGYASHLPQHGHVVNVQGELNQNQPLTNSNQNVIVRWLRPNQNCANGVEVVGEQTSRINPDQRVLVINGNRAGENGYCNEEDKEQIHIVSKPTAPVQQRPIVIIERNMPPPVTKKNKGKILIPIMVNEVCQVKPNPVIIDYMQPVFQRRRRVQPSLPARSAHPPSLYC